MKNWSRVGVGMNFVGEDPGFVDAPKGDYRLKPGSVALREGLEPVPQERVGPGSTRM